MSPVEEELCFLSHWALHVFWCAVCLRKMSIFKEKIHGGEGKCVHVCICVCLCGWKGKSQPVRIMNPNVVLSLEWSYVFSAIDTTTPCSASYNSPQSCGHSYRLNAIVSSRKHWKKLQNNRENSGFSKAACGVMLQHDDKLSKNPIWIEYQSIWRLLSPVRFQPRQNSHEWSSILFPKWLPLGKVFISIPSESVNEWRVPNIIFSPEEREAFSWHSLHNAYVDWMFTTCKA